jgi:hypothetical protein
MIMRRVQKILLIVLLCSSPGLVAMNELARPGVRHDSKAVIKGTRASSRDRVASKEKSGLADFSIKFGGRVRQDFFLWERPFMFGTDSDDVAWYFRSKVEAGVNVKQGENTYGVPAAEAAIKFSSYAYWQANNAYDRHSKEVVTLTGLDGAATADKHFHTDILPRVYLEEAWYKLNLGVLFNSLKNYPISLTVGYFPYLIGRGLALGYHKDLAHTHAGWQGEGGFTRFPSMPPGILIRGKVSDNFSWDIYYNKWRANNYALETVYAPVYANRLNWHSVYRGKDKDRDTVAIRADLRNNSKKLGKLDLQPYFIYTRAPELPIEFEADSKARLGTVGCMTEWSKSGWNVNVEVAGQYGTQELFAWDRNVITLAKDKATGNVQEQYSHLRLARPGATSDEVSRGTKAPVTDELMKAANLPINRTTASNGQPVRNAAGVAMTQGGQTVYNSNLWGSPRIRPNYKVNYGGLMGLADVTYTLQDKPLKAALAVGYIGGDKYPYNTENNPAHNTNLEQNKTYKGFIAQRGFYSGKNVNSILVLEQLVVPRPTNIVNRLLYCENNYRDYSNLQFIGTSMVWNPLAKKEKMSVQPNIIGFWEVSQIKKWDKNGSHPDPTIRAALGTRGITGWMSSQDASKFLGIELNTIVNYNILKNCQFYLKTWVFKPGQLYEDLKGQPSSFGRRAKPDGTSVILSQGTNVSYGFYTGIDYKF